MKEQQVRVRVPDLLAMKKRGQKIAMLTVYDATMAGILDRAGVDVLLVGDSLGMVVLGEETTVGVTVDMIVHHCRAVSRSAAHALVVADLPFLSYANIADAVRNAGRLMQDGRASAVKLEGGAAVTEPVKALANAGVPVMGHLGLLPQHMHKLGGFRAVGKKSEEAEQILRDAHALEEAGAFAIVLESIPAELAKLVTQEISIPTIGIGAGPHCDGQVLVSYDAFGLFEEFVPRFVKRYAHLGKDMTQAAQTYIDEVRNSTFPAPEHSISSK